MQREPVDSSLITSVGYDTALHTLEIELQGARVYQYYEVPTRAYRELLAASSKGAYFNRQIKRRYAWQEVKEEE